MAEKYAQILTRQEADDLSSTIGIAVHTLRKPIEGAYSVVSTRREPKPRKPRTAR